MATHDQDRIVNIDGTFTCTNKALKAVLIELLTNVLIATDLEAATWDIWVLNLLILRVYSLIHRNREYCQVTLLMIEFVIRQDIVNYYSSFQLKEGQETIVDLLFDNLLGWLSLVAALSSVSFCLWVFYLLIMNSLTKIHGNLRLLPITTTVLLHITSLFLHVFVHHVVRKGHRSLCILCRCSDNIIVPVASSTTLNFARVAVTKSVIIHIH